MHSVWNKIFAGKSTKLQWATSNISIERKWQDAKKPGWVLSVLADSWLQIWGNLKNTQILILYKIENHKVSQMEGSIQMVYFSDLQLLGKL